MLVTLGEIVKDLGGLLYGDPSISIDKLAPIQLAQKTELAFLSNSKYSILLKESLAACIIVEPKLLETAMQRGACIVADDPYLYFAHLTQWWQRLEGLNFVAGIHPSAVVHKDAAIDPTASIGPLCVVEQGVRIGANTILRSRVTVAYKCSIGERCIVHSGVVIGADGFGFAINKARAGAWEKIAQLGNVRIGNDVEIGANTCIDRGALDDTCIEDGVKLDNLIQIGHNVKIGKHTAIAGCAGIAGSATIGAHCTIGGGAVVLGHLTIADNVHITASTTVTRSITAPGSYTGFFPVDENALWEKNAASLKQLHKLRERIRSIEKTIDLQVKKNQHDDGYS